VFKGVARKTQPGRQDPAGNRRHRRVRPCAAGFGRISWGRCILSAQGLQPHGTLCGGLRSQGLAAGHPPRRAGLPGSGRPCRRRRQRPPAGAVLAAAGAPRRRHPRRAPSALFVDPPPASRSRTGVPPPGQGFPVGLRACGAHPRGRGPGSRRVRGQVSSAQAFLAERPREGSRRFSWQPCSATS